MKMARGLGLRVALLTVLVFACGLLTGLHLAEGRQTPAATAMSGLEAAHERYFRLFVQDFDLDAKQRRDLRLVLDQRAKMQKDWWNDRLLRDDPRDRATLVRLDRTSEGLIRHLLHREDQKAKYKTLLAGR